MSFSYTFNPDFRGDTSTQETTENTPGATSMARTESGVTDSSMDSGYGSNPPGGWSIEAAFCSETTAIPQVYSPRGHDPSYTLDYRDASYTRNSVPRSPDAFQAFTTCDLFDKVVGSVPDKARQASENARCMLTNGDSMPVRGLLPLDCVDTPVAGGAIKQEQAYNEFDAPEMYRKKVQRALHSYLYGAFAESNVDLWSLEQAVNNGIEEAAYELQRGIDFNVCYFAIADTLVGLRKRLAQRDKETVPDISQAKSRSTGASRSNNQGGGFPCSFPGCSQTPFRRQADCERHFNMVHLDDSEKKHFRCDYKKCIRHAQPFFRQDHFRDHLRDFHKEDLLRRGVKDGAEWWNERAPRAIQEGWWRCNRCLVVRVQIGKHGYVCPNCNNNCEPARQTAREQLWGLQ